MALHCSEIIHNLPIEIQKNIFKLSLKSLLYDEFEFDTLVVIKILGLLKDLLGSNFQSEVSIVTDVVLTIKDREDSIIYFSIEINEKSIKEFTSIWNSENLKPIINITDQRIPNHLLNFLDVEILNHCQFTELRLVHVFWDNEYDWWDRVTYIKIMLYELENVEKICKFSSLQLISIESDESICDIEHFFYQDAGGIYGFSLAGYEDQENLQSRISQEPENLQSCVFDWIAEHLMTIPNIQVEILCPEGDYDYKEDLDSFKKAMSNAGLCLR